MDITRYMWSHISSVNINAFTATNYRLNGTGTDTRETADPRHLKYISLTCQLNDNIIHINSKQLFHYSLMRLYTYMLLHIQEYKKQFFFFEIYTRINAAEC